MSAFDDDGDEIFIPAGTITHPIDTPEYDRNDDIILPLPQQTLNEARTQRFYSKEEILAAFSNPQHDGLDDISSYYNPESSIPPSSRVNAQKYHSNQTQASTYNSFHQKTQQVSYDSNASISYKGTARMLDNGHKSYEEVQEASRKLVAIIDNKIEQIEKRDVSQLLLIVEAELKHVEAELQSDHISHNEKQILTNKYDNIKVQYKTIKQHK